MQEDGASEEASALAIARAHERMLQADLAQAQAAAEQPRAAEAGRSNARQRTAAAGSHAASRSQAQQMQALDRAEEVNAPSVLLSGLEKSASLSSFNLCKALFSHSAWWDSYLEDLSWLAAAGQNQAHGPQICSRAIQAPHHL